MQITLQRVLAALHGLDDVAYGPVDVAGLKAGGSTVVANVMVTGAAVVPLPPAVRVKGDHATAVVTSKGGYCIECVPSQRNSLQAHGSCVILGDAIAAPMVNQQLAIKACQYMHWLMIV